MCGVRHARGTRASPLQETIGLPLGCIKGADSLRSALVVRIGYAGISQLLKCGLSEDVQEALQVVVAVEFDFDLSLFAPAADVDARAEAALQILFY